MTLIRFYIYLVLLTLLQIGVVLFIPNLTPTKDTIEAILFFAILTGIVYRIANWGTAHKSPQHFLTATYISIGLRFVLSLFYVLYYKLTRTEYELGFIFSFFFSYVFYTIFEITSLTTKLRPDYTGKKS
ncbi:MAG: hypothetical protein KBG11_06320 [Bacteroidia bacterium]|nr:hypothetical protein [Bacteroidia bacterium]